MKSTLKSTLKAIKHADSYEAWSAAAQHYDQLSGNDRWKEQDASPHYDYRMIRLRYNELRSARERKDIHGLVYCINEGLHGNLGGVANAPLYQHALFGTKYLISDYLSEVVTGLRWIASTDFADYPLPVKIDFFERTSQSFGQSALMLSGGAGLGLFHLGVVNTLLDLDLLPNVISGSSAGSIFTAMLGTHTTQELRDLFDPERVAVNAFQFLGITEALQGKGLFDQNVLEKCLLDNIPEMTFEEAFQHSGRRINVTVSPSYPHQNPRLLSALTSPHVLVSKAVLASCAVPFLYPPVMLWAKHQDGSAVPYVPSRQWVDGSIKDDLPALRLARLYGVNHTIVSQTNPHVAPFLSRNRREKSIPGVAWDMVVNNTRYNVSKTLEYFARKAEDRALSLVLDKANSVVSQSYSGDINILLPRNPRHLFKVLANATPKDIETYIRLGEREIWPKVEQIRNTTVISRTIQECLETLKVQQAQTIKGFSPTSDSLKA